MVLSALALSGCGGAAPSTSGEAPPAPVQLTTVEQSYIDALHSLGNDFYAMAGAASANPTVSEVIRVKLNTPSLVWIGHRYCDAVETFGPGEVYRDVLGGLVDFIGSQTAASWVSSEANHWLCPNLSALNIPAEPRPGGNSGLEFGTVPVFPSSRVARNPSLPPGWPSDGDVLAPVRIDDLSSDGRQLVQQLRADGADNQDSSLLASAAQEACNREDRTTAQGSVPGQLMLLYPGLNLVDASTVYAAAKSQLCDPARAAAQNGASSSISPRVGVKTESTPTRAAATPSSPADDTSGDLAQVLATFLPEGYEPAVLIEKMEEVNYNGENYGAQTCSTLEKSGPNARYQVSGAGQILMYAYGDGITQSLDAEDLAAFFRLVVEHYCRENEGLIPE